MIIVLINIINFVARVLSLIVLVDVVISYFMSPYNQFRMFLDRLVEPMLKPIRRVIPPLGMVDISPIVLLILIQVVNYILIQIIVSLA